MTPATQIDIGTPIYLNNLLETRMLIQANSGGGKSVLARVLIEKVIGQVPFIVFDIDGEYYTLKEKFGDILVIGGQFADIPINTKTAALLPREIISNRLSVIIDLSDLKMQERIMYVKHFLETMMELPKEFWTSYLIFLEEAHKLCGEQDKQESATAVKDLMSRGRKKGYCGVLITQRISKLHKDAAAECNNKFVGRTFLDNDIERCIRELGAVNRIEQAKILRELKPGEFWAFGTAIDPHHPHLVKIKQPQTKLTKAGSIQNIKPQKPTDKIKALLEKLNTPAAPAETKAAVNSLSKVDTNQIEKLKREADQLKVERDHAANLLKQKEQQLQNYKQLVAFHTKRCLAILELFKKAAPGVIEEIDTKPQVNVTPISRKFTEHNQKFTDKVYEKVADNNTSGNTAVSGGAMRMLKAAAQFYPNSITKSRMGLIARMSTTSGSWQTYLSTLRREGLIENSADGFVATEKGIQTAGTIEPLPSSPGELIEMWCDIIGTQGGAARMLRALAKIHPETYTRQALGEAVSMAQSGSFQTYISTLKRNGLITVSGGHIKAADELFN